jgi:hypothetical protein
LVLGTELGKMESHRKHRSKQASLKEQMKPH